jgi:hypothetical protein
MKKPQQGKNSASGKKSVDASSNNVHLSPVSSNPSVQDVHESTREALSQHLHELLNSLWPAAVQIELAISEETCPPEFRETLEQIGRYVDEAMTIASQASELVDRPKIERVSS